MPKQLKPSLDWLLALVPAAFAVACWPARRKDPALFLCADLALRFDYLPAVR